MKRKLTLSILIYSFLSLTCAAHADQLSDMMRDRLADFIGVSADRIHVECPQSTYGLETGKAGDKVLKICLNKADQQKRCEVTIGDLPKAPVTNKISFEINYANPDGYSEWQSLMQIHSVPDKGEAWRCPVAALEIQEQKFRMFDRWDAQPISTTLGYNCTEAGSSITARPVLSDVHVKAGTWQKVDLTAQLSPETGLIQLDIDKKSSGPIKGPTSYNDQKNPFLKFGIYKPTSWEAGHEQTCVQYRNVKIVSGGN